eukprot:2585411-Pleurochrysis_carterae.AAC.1
MSVYASPSKMSGMAALNADLLLYACGRPVQTGNTKALRPMAIKIRLGLWQGLHPGQRRGPAYTPDIAPPEHTVKPRVIVKKGSMYLCTDPYKLQRQWEKYRLQSSHKRGKSASARRAVAGLPRTPYMNNRITGMPNCT